MTVADWLNAATTKLSAEGIESSRLEAQVLAAHALGWSRATLLAHPEAEVPDRADALLGRRLKREPLAYILGVREFYGRPFFVAPSVLIPRQDTETLVDAALRFARPGDRVLDLGTGSGCIAITLKLEKSTLAVTASDVSSAALDIARKNASALRADIRFVLSDLSENLGSELFDVVVANPPYVESDAALEPEVKDWEPALALFAGADGMEFYKRLPEMLVDLVRESGYFLAEIGKGQGDAVASLFAAADWVEVERIRDLAGIERVMVFRRHNSG